MSALISREQIVRCLRDAGWEFNRQAPRVEIYRKKGTVQRISIPRRDKFSQALVLVLLNSAGMTKEQIDAFLRGCVKS